MRFFVFETGIIQAQDIPVTAKKKDPVYQHPQAGRRGVDAIRVMFYNTEDLDPSDDSAKADEEYIPGGMRGWSFSRLKRKLINISKVTLAVGGWEPPEIIGLCEVENRLVLYQLTNDTPLKNFGYKIIHQGVTRSEGYRCSITLQA